MPAGLDVISGADGDHVSEDRDKAPQIQASSQQWAPARSGPINVPVSSSKPAFVPKLLLPTSQSPGAIIGEGSLPKHSVTSSSSFLYMEEVDRGMRCTL